MEISFTKVRLPPCVRFIEAIWAGALEDPPGKSWVILNGSMHQAVSLAITSRMRFPVDFFTREDGPKRMRMGYWGNLDGWYRLAVRESNLSACKAIESHLGIKPFMDADGHRLGPDSAFLWEGRSYRVTQWGNADAIRAKFSGGGKCPKGKTLLRITWNQLETVRKARLTATRASLKTLGVDLTPMTPAQMDDLLLRETAANLDLFKASAAKP